ncbi:MAG: translocation/assembly module TamB domain-containing protein [Bacteroidaceae bacterium]|nr:translocation/assembly module TamB domain-containing protein [Bacteroidaceae bacterium]
MPPLATINSSFEQLSAQLELSPTTGIQGFFQMDQLKKETQQLHMLRGEIQQDSLGIQLRGEADNGNLEQPHNSTTKTPHFKALLQSRLEKEAGQLLVTYLNEQQDTTFHIGVDAKKQAGKYRFSLFPATPILFEERFTLNDSNQVVFEQEHPIHASVELLDKKGRGFRFYSASNSDAAQDLALELREIELADVAKLLPQSIKMKGILTTELHYMQQEKMHIMASDISIDSLVYNHYPMGNISLTTDYMPQSLQEHFVDSHLSINDKEALSLTGSYRMKGKQLEGNMELKQLPLQLINAFVEQSVATATGFLNGKMEVKGPLSALVSNGEVSFEKTSFKSEMLGSQFYLTDRPVTVKKNQLLFDNFTLHGENNSPFSIKGNIDFNHLEQPIIDLKLTANDYELLHAKKKKRSMLYGKMYIDVDATLKGALDNLAVKGNLQLLGKTDATYVLTESALTVENRLDDLVTFTNFNDTLSTKKEAEKEYQLGGLHMLLHVQIERGTHLNVDIDKNSYLKAEGGGELTLQYTPQGDLLFNGRYAFTSGEMKYSLPIIPLKTFTIQNGSYVEWMGNPMDPNLSIVATELISAKVTLNELPRMVDFEVGVGISNKLSNIGLTFVIDAPESATLQNDLATLSADQRNKQAITLLATGIYLGSGNAQQKIDVNDALNSFLQTEISSMAKSALKTVDISFGMETVEGETTDEAAHTDYSFRFAKRFWNNRLNVIIGGRISTGTDRQTQSFIDDVTLEWRLDTSGTRYVTLFHKKNYDDILDSEITETGVGLVLRKKIDRLSELFTFKKKRKEQVQIEKKELEKEKNSKK